LAEQKGYIEKDKATYTKQIVFAKLCSLSHDMLCFDLDRERIKDLMQIFATSYKLGAPDVQELFVSTVYG